MTSLVLLYRNKKKKNKKTLEQEKREFYDVHNIITSVECSFAFFARKRCGKHPRRVVHIQFCFIYFLPLHTGGLLFHTPSLHVIVLFPIKL